MAEQPKLHSILSTCFDILICCWIVKIKSAKKNEAIKSAHITLDCFRCQKLALFNVTILVVVFQNGQVDLNV